MLKRIKEYIRKTESYSVKRIIIEFSLLAIATKPVNFILSILVITFIAIFILLPILLINPAFDLNQIILPTDQHPASEKIKMGGIEGFITFLEGITIVPMKETLLWQVVPIWIVSCFTKKRKIAVIVSAIIFALVHFYPLQIIFVFPVGLILAWAYIIIKPKSFWKAYFATALIHSFYNLVSSIAIKFLPF